MKTEQHLTVIVVLGVGVDQEGVITIFFALVTRQGVVRIRRAGNIYSSGDDGEGVSG